MSSRIIRRGDLARGRSGSEEPQPIQWRPHGQGRAPLSTTPSAGAQRAGTGSSDDPDRGVGDSGELRAAAYQQGVAAGEAGARLAAEKSAQTRLEPALASFQSMVTELAGTRKKLRGETEQAAVALAIEVARRVLHREIAADPEALLGLVKAAFQKCDARATQRLRVSPQDAEAIRENQARLNLPPGLEIAADRSLARGSAIFETSRGDLDVSVDTQLAEIERGFADVLKRRHP